jgi:hypothetical protein
MTGKPRTWPLATEWVGRGAQVRAQHSDISISILSPHTMAGNRNCFLAKDKENCIMLQRRRAEHCVGSALHIYAPGPLDRGNSYLGAKCTLSPIYRAVASAWRLTDRIRQRSRTGFVRVIAGLHDYRCIPQSSSASGSSGCGSMVSGNTLVDAIDKNASKTHFDTFMQVPNLSGDGSQELHGASRMRKPICHACHQSQASQ